jgi:hypothetical protein
MKPITSLPLLAWAIVASFSLLSTAKADTYKAYSFDTAFKLPTYDITVVLPSGLTDAAINDSFGVSLTNGVSSGPYSISPVASTFIQRIFLGTVADPFEFEVTAADLGTVLSTVGPPNSAHQYDSANGIVLGDLSSYTEITIDTDFTLGGAGDPVASGSGSVDIYEVPEPSTWTFLLGGAGMLAFMAIRRSRTRHA